MAERGSYKAVVDGPIPSTPRLSFSIASKLLNCSHRFFFKAFSMQDFPAGLSLIKGITIFEIVAVSKAVILLERLILQ